MHFRFNPVTHVIFDLDGLLLASEEIYEKAASEIAQKFGKTLSKETRFKLLGRNQIDGARILIKDLRLPITIEECVDMYIEGSEKYLNKVNLMPGVVDLIYHLKLKRVPIAIATSSPIVEFEQKIYNHSVLFDLFHHVVCGSTDPEVKHGKPAPDIYLVCASRFDEKPLPRKCLVFEDAPNGIKGAIAAGMQAIMVPDPKLPLHLREEATLVLKSLKDFDPKLFGLPARTPKCICENERITKN